MKEDTTLSDMQQRLDELRSLFCQQLPGKLEEIRAVWRQLGNDWSAEKVHQLHQLCHSLAGSGGTFGAQEVGHSARKMEQTLKALASAAQPPGSEILQQLDEQVRAITRSCERWVAIITTH